MARSESRPGPDVADPGPLDAPFPRGPAGWYIGPVRRPTAPNPLTPRESPAGAPASPPGAHQGDRARGRGLMFASAVLFGLAAMLAKVAARAGMGGGQATLVRLALGLSAAVVLFRLRPGTFRPARWGLLAVRGLVGGAAALLYYLAIARIPAGEATPLAIGIVTLSQHRLQEKEGRWLKLVSGLVILSLGLMGWAMASVREILRARTVTVNYRIISRRIES